MESTGYRVYLDDVLFPITPSNINLKVKNKNQTLDLINGGELNILKSAGLTEISFNVIIPQITKYPFAMYLNNEFKDLIYYTNKLEDLKSNKKTAQFKVIRRTPTGGLLYDTNMTVSLEDYEIVDSVDNGFDVEIHINLKQYVSFKTKIHNIGSTGSSERETAKEIPYTYVVKPKDSLWKIAKKYLGDGRKFTELAKLNNIANPNLIYPKQVLRLK